VEALYIKPVGRVGLMIVAFYFYINSKKKKFGIHTIHINKASILKILIIKQKWENMVFSLDKTLKRNVMTPRVSNDLNTIIYAILFFRFSINYT
jgi:hypothetical protein